MYWAKWVVAASVILTAAAADAQHLGIPGASESGRPQAGGPGGKAEVGKDVPGYGGPPSSSSAYGGPIVTRKERDGEQAAPPDESSVAVPEVPLSPSTATTGASAERSRARSETGVPPEIPVPPESAGR